MAGVEIRGLAEVQQMLKDLPAYLKEAGDKAQTRMAYQIREGAIAQMVGDLDRPVPWSLKNVLYKAAGKIKEGAPNVEGAAVYFGPTFGDAGLEPSEWLGVQMLDVPGGTTAGPRASETTLRNMRILPEGKVWAPDKAAKLDAYGNVDGNTIRAMITDLYRAPDGKGSNFFVLGGLLPDGNPRGIFAKTGRAWLPFLWFIDPVQYKDRFDFYGRADREVELKFKDIFDDEIRYALGRL